MASNGSGSKWRWGLVALVAAVTATVASCGGLAFTVANTPALFEDYTRQANIAYGGDMRQRLDVYRPEAVGLRPVVVFFYGGGWRRGDKANYRFAGAALADAGYVAVLPDYRLYPDVKFPAFVEDGAAAVAWVVQNAAAIGADPRQIFLAGHSAGAHTAAMLAADTRFLERAGVDPKAVRGLIGLSGPYHLTPDTSALRDMFGGAYGPNDWRPTAFASARVPPTLLIHGTDDSIVWASHSERFAELLRAADVPVTLRLLTGRSHADTVAGLSRPARSRAPTLAEIREFINAQTDRSR
jgi:acetyl esterase/lipase